ncbi:MAG: BGTF surface domain-containing protein, partial [Halodesulfurarchaeum sp.]
PRGAQSAGGANRTDTGTANGKAAANSPGPVGNETLAAGSYTLVVTGPEAQRANDTVRVTANWSASIETFVAPRDVSLADPGDIRAHASQRDEVAVGDRLVIAIDTNGLGEYANNISAGGPPPHANNSKLPEQSNATKPRASDEGKGDGPPAFVSVGPAAETASEAQNVSGVKRIDTTAQDQFYVVAEADGGPLRPGTNLESAVVLTEETPFVSAETQNGSAETSGRDTLEVIEARATLDGGSKNGSFDLPNGESVSINGTTTVAPGTKATVHLDGANDSFSDEYTLTVSDDGTYETTANLSDYESGTEYTVSVTADDEQLSEVRSGQFLDTRSGTDAASGGGGGDGGGWLSGSSESEEEESGQSETTTAHETTTGPADSIPDAVRKLPPEAARRAWSVIPEPLRIGPTELLLIALGSLALLTVGRGIVRLLRP